MLYLMKTSKMKSYKSLYPNHAHQLTLSVSKHYWVTKTGVVKYQSKPFEIDLEKLDSSSKIHLVHYLLRDHCTGVVYTEVCTSDNLTLLIDFLFRAWSKKENFAFCGIPELLTIPNTIENKFPGIRKKVFELGVEQPKVTSGFQSGVRDIRTIEQIMPFYIDKIYSEIKNELNELHISLSTKMARNGRETKIEMWLNNVKDLMVPSEIWKATE